jgi:hypothetical protein
MLKARADCVSGYNSEVQLCAARDYPKPDESLLISSCDPREARET